MDYTTWKPAIQQGMEEEKEVVQSLHEALQELSDARRRQGKRYPLAFILCALILAKLAGQKTLRPYPKTPILAKRS